MDSVAYAIAAAVCWIMLAYKAVASVREPDNTVLRAVAVAFAWPAIAFTLAVPEIFDPINQAVGIHNLPKMVEYGSLIAFSFMVQRMLLIIQEGPGARRAIRQRAGIFGAFLTALIVLLLLAPVPAAGKDFTTDYATAPYVLETNLVYVAALGYGLVEIGRISWRCSGIVARSWFRRGLRIASVGAYIALPYCVLKALYAIGRNVGQTWGALDATQAVFAALGAILVCVGLTIPAWGERLSEMRGWSGNERSYRAIRPVWAEVAAFEPGIVLDGANRHGLAWRGHTRSEALYRYLIEIRDGQLLLNVYRIPEVDAEAEQLGRRGGLSGNELEAFTEACFMRYALEAKRRGRVPSATVPPGIESCGTDVRSEANWLTRVARYWGNPLVSRFVAAQFDTVGAGSV